MPVEPIFFEKPNTGRQELRLQPRLVSWVAAGHPDQIRLEEYLAYVERLVQPRLEELVGGPWSLHLNVQLPASILRLDQRDLDNYLFPLLARLSARTGKRFVSVWGSKQHAETPSICIDPAVPAKAPPRANRWVVVRTTASSESTAYKQQIHDQLVGLDPLGDGPVSMHLSFTVGPGRNWINLWKPTIDALDPILGSIEPERPWHPRDGRITELALHCHVEPEAGDEVQIAVAASAIAQESGMAPHVLQTRTVK
jgi:hypothetical protein